MVSDDGVVIYESLSRSCNRIMLGAFFERQKFIWQLQAWYRIPEEKKEDPAQAEGDDSPDIDHLGNFELTFHHLIKERCNSALMMRNNLDFDKNRGAVRVELSFPLMRKLDGMLQVFHGYGEHLLDYSSRNTRVGFGFALRGL